VATYLPQELTSNSTRWLVELSRGTSRISLRRLIVCSTAFTLTCRSCAIA
jgi:hypothetical protein